MNYLSMNHRLHYRFSSRLRALLIFTSALVLFAGAHAESSRKGALLNELRHGGYVLVMRHASSPRQPPQQSAAQPDNLTVERELDEAGRESARTMGQAFQQLLIPVGVIETSPTYRARQTLKLAGFSTPSNVPQLGDGGENMQADTAGSRSAWLHQRVSDAPRTGTNTLLVTHLPNIQGAFGQQAADVADGETLVFRPDGKGSAALVARIKIQEWSHLAEATP